MNKLLPVIMLALAASVAAVAIADSMASAGAESPAVEPYKCYQARHAKRSPRFTPDTVFLTDQFRHNVEVSVLKLSTHCSEADQHLSLNGSAAGDFDRGLDCYTIRDARGQPQFHPVNIPVSDPKFGSQVLTVSKAANLCVPGLKDPATLRLQGGGFVCYQARTANGQPRFQQRSIVVEDQFTEKDVRVIRPVAYCSLSEKKLDAPNDDIGDAQRIDKDLIKEGDPLDLHVSTVHATPELTDPIISCKTDYSNSVWYHWRHTGNKSLMLDTAGSSYDTVLAVFSGSPGSLLPVGCNDNGCPVLAGATAAGCATTASFLQFDAWANTDYYILVGSSERHGGKLKLRVSAKDVVGTADSCGSPIPLSLLQEKGDSFLEHVSTMDATFDTGVAVAGGACGSGDPALSCTPGGYGYGSSAWFTYTSTVPGNDQLVNFDATASSYSTVIAVFDTTVTIGRGEVACGNSGFVSVSLTAGHKYLIMVAAAGQGADGGKLKLRYELKRQLINPDGVDAGATTLRFVGNSLVCYQVRQARHAPIVDDVTDQFSERQLDGAWTLSIGAVDSICLPALKPPCSTHAYANNFQSVVGSEWSNTSTDTTPVGHRRFLGQFGSETVSLNLNGLPNHDQVTVCFDLFAIQSWDGNDTGYGPDEWDLSVNGGPTLLHTTFSNTEEDGHQQNYPESFPGGKHPAYTGATEVDSLGYDNPFGDAVYHFVFTFPHTAGSIQLDFSALGIDDESWGLDNVIVQTK